MNYIFLLIAVVIGLIFQSTFFEVLRIDGLKPDAVLLLVIFYAIQQGPRKGALFGFVAGLLQDFFTAKFLGLHAVIKCVVGILAGLFEKRVYKENALAPALISIPATYLQEALYIVMRQLAGFLTHEYIPFVKTVTQLAIYQFFMALFGYYLYMKLSAKNFFPRPQRRF